MNNKCQRAGKMDNDWVDRGGRDATQLTSGQTESFRGEGVTG